MHTITHTHMHTITHTHTHEQDYQVNLPNQCTSWNRKSAPFLVGGSLINKVIWGLLVTYPLPPPKKKQKKQQPHHVLFSPTWISVYKTLLEMPRKKRCLRPTCLTVADVEKTSRQTLCPWRAEPYVVRVDCGVGQLGLGTNITPQGNALACLDILLVHTIYRPGTERSLSFSWSLS